MFRKSTSVLENSPLSKEVQAKNQESLLRRDMEDKLKQTEDSTRTAFDFANRELIGLRLQLSQAAEDRTKLEADFKAEISNLTSEAYWNKLKITEVTEEMWRVMGEKEALIDACRQLQRENAAAAEHNARASFGSYSESIPKSFEGPSSFPSFGSFSGQISELEAIVAITKSELVQCKARVSELLQTVKTKDSEVEALQMELEAKTQSAYDLTLTIEALKSHESELSEDLNRQLQNKDALLKARGDQVDRLKEELVRAKLVSDEGCEKLSVQQKLNDALSTDLRLIKQFLSQVIEGRAEDNPAMNPAGLSSSQIVAAAESSQSAKSLLEQIAQSLEGLLSDICAKLDGRTTELLHLQGDLSLALVQRQQYKENQTSLETELRSLKESYAVERKTILGQLEETKQTLAAKSTLCERVAYQCKLTEERLGTLQTQKVQEEQRLTRKLTKLRRASQRNPEVQTQHPPQNEGLIAERNALKGEVTKLTVQLREVESKFIDQSEKRRQLEEAYESIKGYAPDYVKEIITQATKYDFKYSSIEALVTQIDALKEQLRQANAGHVTDPRPITTSGIKTGYLSVNEKDSKRTSQASQDSELKNWNPNSSIKDPRDRCGCRLF
jgi:chromosome segregation ATPase